MVDRVGRVAFVLIETIDPILGDEAEDGWSCFLESEFVNALTQQRAVFEVVGIG